MIVAANTILGDTWRLAVTLLALLLLSLFWYVVVRNVTPFSASASEKSDSEKPASKPWSRAMPSKFPRIQRVTVICDVVLFIWIVVEGAIVIPIMLTKYGLH